MSVQPKPPSWLIDELDVLRGHYPEDDFTAVMRPRQVDASSMNVIKTGRELTPGSLPSTGTQFLFIPRIRCKYCPEKLYEAGRGKVVEQFGIHLRNRQHLRRRKNGPRDPSRPLEQHSHTSYWTVPEQADFVKYLGHFGTDFAAIAAHMGTKTQSMIKNHYLRQIDGGNRPDLEEEARIVNAKRNRGEDMGPPPVPTPIVKRKYDSIQPDAPASPY